MNRPDRFVSELTDDEIISNLNHYTAINCRAITGYPYGITKSCKDDT